MDDVWRNEKFAFDFPMPFIHSTLINFICGRQQLNFYICICTLYVFPSSPLLCTPLTTDNTISIHFSSHLFKQQIKITAWLVKRTSNVYSSVFIIMHSYTISTLRWTHILLHDTNSVVRTLINWIIRRFIANAHTHTVRLHTLVHFPIGVFYFLVHSFRIFICSMY